MLTACTGTTFVMKPGSDEATATAVADADAVTVTYDSTKGKVTCMAWDDPPTKYVTFTASGWAEKAADTDETSGAMHLASAVAAGALAVAATQF